MTGRIHSTGEITYLRQRRFGGKGVPPQEAGDCWATAVACFAGLTERDRNELHRRIVLSDLAIKRARGGDGEDPSQWWNVTQRFLREKVGKVLGWADGDSVPPGGLWIASGPSPRGDWLHCVIAYGDGRLLHDPHPSNAGVPEIVEWVGWWEAEAA